ncbi:MAG TPA: hypothetical protein VK335_09290 [Bryobacteraceae bacterium]|nr:hypothetical protein [Bryobacteraceae bacterium]
MTELPAKQPAAKAGEPTLEFVEDDLKLALTFVQISSAAYSTGNLQHGGDARSKAEVAHARAVAKLIESSAVLPQDASVQSMLREVQSALSSLPSSARHALWMRRAAG